VLLPSLSGLVHRLALFFFVLVLGNSAHSQGLRPPNPGLAIYEQALELIGQGEVDRATKILEAVVEKDPTNAGAWLDLALLYCQSGRALLAADTFDTLTRKFQVPPSILSLITFQQELGCGSKRAVKIDARLAIGHASNVNSAPSSDVIRFGAGAPISFLELSQDSRPRADTFLGGTVSAAVPTQGANQGTWFFGADSRSYFQEKDFDSQNLVLGYSESRFFDHSSLKQADWFASINHWRIGGESVESSLRLGLDLWAPNASPLSPEITLGVGSLLSRTTYDANRNFDGDRVEFLLLAAWQSQHSEGRYFFGPAADWAKSQRPGGDRLGWVLGGRHVWTSSVGRTQLGLGFDLLADQEIYNQTFFSGVKRETRRFYATVRHEIPLGLVRVSRESLLWFFQAGYERTSDSISIFSYENQTLTTGISGRW